MSRSEDRRKGIISRMPWPARSLILSALCVGLLPLLCVGYSLNLACDYPSDCGVDVEDDGTQPYVRLVATVRDGEGDPVSVGTVSWEVTQGSGTLGDWGYPNSSGNGPGVWSAQYNPSSANEQTHKIKATWGFTSFSANDTINITVRRPTHVELILDPNGISINETTDVYAYLVDDITGDAVWNEELTLLTDAACADGIFDDAYGACSGNSVLFWYSSEFSPTGYTPLSADPATHTITAQYPLFVGSKYSSSSTSTTLNVLKRLVEIDVQCDTADQANYTHTVTVTVTDSDKNEGDPITPTGEIQGSDQEWLCDIGGSDRDATGSFTITTSTGHPEIVIPYYPGDASHYPMVGQPLILGGDPTSLSLVPVFSLIGSYQKMCWGLSLASTLTSAIGGTVCAWLGVADITDAAGAVCATAVNATVLAINLAQSTVCRDWDADGIYDEIEDIYCNRMLDSSLGDTDGDTLGDAQEIGWADGWMDTNPDDGLDYCPSPMLLDSDGDGLDDGEEFKQFQTDFCMDDTDGDGVSDCDEVQTFYGVAARALTTDHADPLVQDSDGDGLSDLLEFDPGRLATDASTLPYNETANPTGYSPFVNDADSDSDGLLDGIEDVNANVTWDGTLGDTGSTGTGETHLCLADTDADGLSDGEEEALFGPGPQDVHSTLGTITTPALDDDSDDDGLSDYEEQVVTQTDPLHWDTDGDGLSDADELIVIGGTFPTRSFDQACNPLSSDTDGDGLSDAIEYGGSGVVRTTSTSGGTQDATCPYVDDNDSDDDGLQDGVEDWGGDGMGDFPATLGETGTQASLDWETDPCNEDTDDDGLTDGEECRLLGGLRDDPEAWHDLGVTSFEFVSAVTDTAGTTVQTIPALDDDCDDDGLSDYEEVNITGTDPLDADSDDDGLLDSWELIVTGGTFPLRSFHQESDPLDPDTDDDEIRDDVEYNDGNGSGVGRDSTSGTPDTTCPYVNDPDSDDDGLQDGTEDANHDGTWGVSGAGITIGTFDTPAARSVDYWETDLCNPDTDGDGLSDGEECSLLGGVPIAGRPRPVAGFETVIPEKASTVLPLGTGPAGSPPGTGNSQLGPYTFAPIAGAPIAATVPALDVDSDNDGLSDFEEVNITGTDALDQDTDNDTLIDADELIATGGTPGATPNRTFDQESDPLDTNSDDDFLFDPQEYEGSGLSLLAGAIGGERDIACPSVANDDSDDDGIQDGDVVEVAVASVITAGGQPYAYVHYEDFLDIEAAGIPHPGILRIIPDEATGEQQDDALWNVCDADSDGDGLNDGEETSLGTDPGDWDTDDDGRNDWHESTGGGPIPTDPFDPDTDDDGLLDSVEVFGLNSTDPTDPDTDDDGLCDGGAGTPWMLSGDLRVRINPVCKSCSISATDVGLDPCVVAARTGSSNGIGDHPNPHGYGEDKNGNGVWEPGSGDYWGDVYAGDETDPNQYDTDGDADGDGVEVLGFSTSRQSWIPTVDQYDRPITVVYPDCGCLNPLDPDTDGDQLEDGYEDRNHDGNFDFLASEFDSYDPLPGPPIPYPTETNPCDPDTDHDDLTDYEERYQSQVSALYADWDNDGDGLYNEDPYEDGIDEDLDGLDGEDPVESPFNPTNPLDHDTDNDWILDGPEVMWTCVEMAYFTLDNDTDGLTDEDPVDEEDNDGDGLIDEDPIDYWVRFIPMLDPTNRDSDSDGYIDGLDDDPCNSELIPLLDTVTGEPIDTDGDGFSDDDEAYAGTHPNDPDDYPAAYGMMNMDLDECFDDRLWLEPAICCGLANSVVIDIDSDLLADIRVQIVQPYDVSIGDYDGDGFEDDAQYLVEYAFALYRAVQRRMVATITDYDMDLVIDSVELERK